MKKAAARPRATCWVDSAVTQSSPVSTTISGAIALNCRAR